MSRLKKYFIKVSARFSGAQLRFGSLLFLILCVPAVTAAQPFPQNAPPKLSQPGVAPQNALPRPLREVEIDQRLNDQIPLDLEFVDESGRTVALREYFGRRPVILALVYFDCPMLCTQILTGLTGSLKALSFNPGKDFEVLAVSFDPREKPTLAAAKKRNYLERYGRQDTAGGWHFLTGDEARIRSLTDAVGFRYRWDDATNQFAHASGIMILTPEGKIARYFYGIEYAPRDVRFALVEASANRIGSPVDQLLLFCFHYDPATGKYGFVIMNAIRLGAAATFLGVGVLIVVMRRRTKTGRFEEPGVT